MRDDDMGPLVGAEGGILLDDEAVVEGGVGIGREVLGVPGFEVAEDAEAEVAGAVVFGEVDPDGGVVVVLGGQLEGIAVAGGEVFIGVEAEPEGESAGGEVDVFGGFEVDGVFIFGFEAEGAGPLASSAGGEGDVGGGGEAGLAGGVALVAGGGEELGVALGDGGFTIVLKRSVEEKSFGQGGESEQE